MRGNDPIRPIAPTAPTATAERSGHRSNWLGTVVGDRDARERRGIERCTRQGSIHLAHRPRLTSVRVATSDPDVPARPRAIVIRRRSREVKHAVPSVFERASTRAALPRRQCRRGAPPDPPGAPRQAAWTVPVPARRHADTVARTHPSATRPAGTTRACASGDPTAAATTTLKHEGEPSRRATAHLS